MNVLFICRHNRFRSKVAEAFFNKYNKDRGNKARSAGVMVDLLYEYSSSNIVKALEEKNAKVESEKSRQVDEYLLKWADKVIIVADNVNKNVFEGKDVEKWEVEDCSQEDMNGIRLRVDIIEKKVKGLIKKLSRYKSLNNH